MKRRAVVLIARCENVENSTPIPVNPLFVELDLSINAIRFICCSCGEAHTRQGPEGDPSQTAHDYRIAGARVFYGVEGDLALAWKD